ncbi:MAG TPA: class II aldolase/adducin family protein [Candidatus Avidehalobacter gallistercoris]|uniref:Class II aldolase/adducin family protein n=1 Tax=Candidatus Avidehalobacter gallistercoris TaxID=2840694 RepID=A0A9D1KZ50_9FIRM|nr:class II aldolase/adducin family protein [Candidatus Avidehalobacter gallistercoris]
MKPITYERAAADIVTAGARLYQTGLVAGNDGNLSVRLNENEVLLTPTGVSKGELLPDMLVLVDMQGDVLSGRLRPTSEWALHLMVYQHDPEMRAVIHAHAPYAAAFALAGRGLSGCKLAEVTECLGEIPLLPYAPPGSIELARQVGQAAADSRGALMAAHGPVCWGADMRQALYRLEELELACRIVWLAEQMK